jgi:hypothetical protein
MTSDQEILLDEIMQRHKDNNGVFNWNDYIVEHLTEGSPKYRMIAFVKDVLMEKGLIRFYLETDKMTTSLTEKGNEWVSAEHERDQIKKQERNKWIENLPKRYWYISGIIVYIGGILSAPLADHLFPKKEKPSQQIVIYRDSVKGIQGFKTDSVELKKGKETKP